MCGIAGAYLRDSRLSVDLDAMLDTMLNEIEHRGGDATGFIALDSEGVSEWHRAAVDVPDFKKYRRAVPKGTRTILAHTRYATQGLPGFNENNHPIRRGSFYAVHNGHVSNDQQLFRLADRDPFGQVDSEAIPARLASLGSLADTEILMEEIEGAAAIAAVDAKNPADLVLAKGHSSPLYVLVTNKVVLFGSTKSTVEKAYKKHIGRLPRKRQIECLDAGDLILFQDGKQTRSTFKPYAPVYRSYSFTPSAWQENETGDSEGVTCSVPSAVPATAHLPKVGGWPKWDDNGEEDDALQTECDVCGLKVAYSEAQYVTDPLDSKLTWVVCSDECADEAMWTGSEDPGTVNAAILAEDAEIED